MDDVRNVRKILFICALLAAGTLAVYWPAFHHQFLNFDDPEYVTLNPQVTAGLTWRGFLWAFTTSHAGNWHPMTWLSHQLDCQLFDLSPAGHHLVNVILHIANACLLFVVLRRMTCRAGPPSGMRERPTGVVKVSAIRPVNTNRDSEGAPSPSRLCTADTSLWCSALVAGLFALHPLHVESVA